MKDPKHLIRIDRAEGKVIVGIAAIVEMKSAKHLLREQPGHDLLDILPLIVMPRIDQHLGLRSGGLRQVQGHAPVGNVSVIEGRFERLVFDEQSLVRRKLTVRFRQCLLKPAFALANVRRPGIVRAIGEPHRDIAAMQLARDLNAFLCMLQRTRPD